ncbi:Adaptor protein complex sigma subunit [Mycena amicta]|nr:Adaptor protein complex sigma subunit [Mycena amicta]
MFSFVLLISRQGRVRLAKWFSTVSSKQKQRIVLDLTSKVLARRPRMCNVIEYKDTRVIYKRYASLYFVAGLDSSDNELISLEVIHRYVEILDRYFGNVTELDLIFNFQRAYAVLDEVVLAGEMQESSKSTALRTVKG